MTTIGKFFKWTVLIVLAVSILGIVSLWLFFPANQVKEYAIEKGTTLLDREISIETASVSFWGGIGIQLENIVIKNNEEFPDDELLTAKFLDVKLQFIPLIFGDVAVNRLILKEPVIKLEKKATGENNFIFHKIEEKVPPEIIKQTTPETKVASAIITFENIELQDCALHYQDKSTNRNISISGFDLHSTFRSSFENQYISSGEFEIKKLIITDSLGLPEIQLSMDYEALYNPKNNSITLSEAELTINGLAGKIKGSFENIFSTLETKLNIQSEQQEIKKLLTLLPVSSKELLTDYKIDGELGLNVDIEYTQKDLQYFGTLKLNQLALQYAEIPGDLICQEVLVDVKNDNVRFNIKEGEFDGKPIKGYLTVDNFEDPFVNGSFAGSLNLKYIEPFLSQDEKHTLTGVASFDLKSSGKIADPTNLNINGVLKSKNFSYNSSSMLEPIDSSTLEIYFDNEIVSIKELSAHTKSGTFSLEGRVISLLQYLLADSVTSRLYNPTINGKLKGDLQLSLLTKILPPKGNPELKGDLSVDLQMSGSIRELTLFRPYGKINIKNGYYSDDFLPEKITYFDAQLAISPDTIIVQNLQSKFESSDARFQGKLVDPFPYLLPLKNIDRSKVKKPLFLFTLESNRFDSDKLFPEAVPGVADETGNISIDSISTMILPDIDGRGTFAIDTLIYGKVELTELHGNVSIENKKIECYDVVGNVYSGRVEGNTTIDLTDFENPKYVGSFNAIQIEVKDFANRFSKFQDLVYGKVDMKGSYSAIGWEPEQFLNSLTMNSTSSIQKGMVKLSDNFIAKSNPLFSKYDSKLNKEQTIRNLFTNIIVKDGKVSFDKFQSKVGDIGGLEVDGFYSFTGDIDYNLNVKFTKEWSNKITNNITDKLTLPFPIKGTVDNPEFKIDYSLILKDNTTNLIKNLFK